MQDAMLNGRARRTATTDDICEHKLNGPTAVICSVATLLRSCIQRYQRVSRSLQAAANRSLRTFFNQF